MHSFMIHDSAPHSDLPAQVETMSLLTKARTPIQIVHLPFNSLLADDNEYSDNIQIYNEIRIWSYVIK